MINTDECETINSVTKKIIKLTLKKDMQYISYVF